MKTHHPLETMLLLWKADQSLLMGSAVLYVLEMERPKEDETSCISWLYPQVSHLHYQSDLSQEFKQSDDHRAPIAFP